jgi:Ca2+-binding EF-hand superfamily protein
VHRPCRAPSLKRGDALSFHFMQSSLTHTRMCTFEQGVFPFPYFAAESMVSQQVDVRTHIPSSAQPATMLNMGTSSGHMTPQSFASTPVLQPNTFSSVPVTVGAQAFADAASFLSAGGKPMGQPKSPFLQPRSAHMSPVHQPAMMASAPGSALSIDPSAAPPGGASMSILPSPRSLIRSEMDATSELSISPDAYARFSDIFDSVDSSGRGYLTGAQARGVLSQSGLATSDLRGIWDLADSDKTGLLHRHGFVICQFLIQHRLAGHALPDALPASLQRPPPSLGSEARSQASSPSPSSIPMRARPPPPSPPPAPPPKAPPPPQPSQPVSFSSLSRPASGDSRTAVGGGAEAHGWWRMEDYAKFAALFREFDTDADGYISGLEARPMLKKSELPVSDLRRIWDLADLSGDGRLDRHEFAVAMLLVQARRAGVALPESLPHCLTAPPEGLAAVGDTERSSSGGVAGGAVSGAQQVATQQQQQQQPFTSALVQPLTGAASGVAMHDTVASASASASAHDSLANMGEFEDAAEDLAVGATARSASATLEPSKAELSAAYAMFAPQFAQLDSDGDGFISGAEARPVLSQSGLATSDLRKIWDLADVGADGKLDGQEFVIAMLLMAKCQRGEALPSVLPPALLSAPPESLPSSAPAPSLVPDPMPKHGQSHSLLPEPIAAAAGRSLSADGRGAAGMGGVPRLGSKNEAKKSLTLSEMMAASMVRANLDLESASSNLPAAFGNVTWPSWRSLALVAW